MKNKEKLFVYGSLADPIVQKLILGRFVRGSPDSLLGHRKSEIKIEGEIYLLIIRNKDSRVQGLVIEATKNELKKIDDYETEAYKRVKMVLESGLSAWVYVKR